MRYGTANLYEISSACVNGLETTSSEVQHRTQIAYGCDCNDLSPLAALTYSLADGSVLRASYTLSYGQVYPVTYQQARFDPPEIVSHAILSLSVRIFTTATSPRTGTAARKTPASGW